MVHCKEPLSRYLYIIASLIESATWPHVRKFKPMIEINNRIVFSVSFLRRLIQRWKKKPGSVKYR